MTRGFTLAEVLITLAIIGVVAALTIPTLIANYQEKLTVSRLTKAYALINNAYALAKIDNGPFLDWFTTPSSITTDENGNTILTEVTRNNMTLLWNNFAPYLKIVSKCDASESECEKYDARYYVNGVNSNADTAHSAVLNLADGTTISGGYINSFIHCKDNDGNCGDFSIDINGIKQGPNTFGKDIFFFYFTPESIKPYGHGSIKPFETDCDPKSTTATGYGCTAWVIENKNMDYLKCSDLNWTNKTKCN